MSNGKRFKTYGLLFLLGLSLGLGVAHKSLKADIIDDIEELEKDQEKDPNKKPDKKKDKKDKADTESAPDLINGTQGGGKKPSKPKATQKENPDPETQTLIPEPLEEPVGANPPPKSPALKSAKGKSKEQRKKAPVHFQSDGVATYSDNGQTVLIEKNVVITQDDLRLQSDQAKINFAPKNSSEKIRTAVLEGKVAITRYSNDPTERMNAKSDKATFDNVQQRVTLEGNARLWREGDLLKGDRIVYDLTTGQVKIDKAQGVMQPDRMKK